MVSVCRCRQAGVERAQRREERRRTRQPSALTGIGGVQRLAAKWATSLYPERALVELPEGCAASSAAAGGLRPTTSAEAAAAAAAAAPAPLPLLPALCAAAALCEPGAESAGLRTSRSRPRALSRYQGYHIRLRNVGLTLTTRCTQRLCVVRRTRPSLRWPGR